MSVPLESHDHPTGSAKKGRPTPKRKDAEAANRRNLIAGEKGLTREERKALKRRERARRDEYFARQEEAMRTGDERYLPVRDKGPARRFIRQYIDKARSYSEFGMPVAFLLLIISLFLLAMPQVQRWMVIAAYALMVISIIEGVIRWHMCKKMIISEHPKWDIPKWSGWYFYTRMITYRKLRMPKPNV